MVDLRSVEHKDNLEVACRGIQRSSQQIKQKKFSRASTTVPLCNQVPGPILAAVAEVRSFYPPLPRRKSSEMMGRVGMYRFETGSRFERLDIRAIEDKVLPGFPYASEALNVTHPCVCFPSHAGFDGGYGPKDCRHAARRRFLCHGKRYGTCAHAVAEKWAGPAARTVEERTGPTTCTLVKIASAEAPSK